MKEPSLSPSTRALLDAAKSDGPRAAARLKMWGAVSTATGIAAAAQAGAATGTAVAAASSAKLLVAGAIFGSALTVGVALAVVRVVSAGPAWGGARLEAPVAAEAARSTAAVDTALDSEGSRNEPPPIPLTFSTLGVQEGLPFERDTSAGPGRPTVRGSAGIGTAKGLSGRASVQAAAEDLLGRETRLILEAQGALRRGNPEAALASLDAARRVGSHQLEPEELRVRAKTLRALGRDAEADDVWSSLKARYPDQAR